MNPDPIRLRRQASDLASLPTLSEVVHLVGAMAEHDRTTAQDLGQVIARDQALSARILRLVNSPFYGFPKRISSISHAVVLLGLNVVKGLALSTTVFDTLARESRGLWEHSLGTALLSRRMARELEHPDAEEIMVAGLLHDLGKVVMAHLAADAYAEAMRTARTAGAHIAAGELAVFGVDHCIVGAWVAESWHLPERLAESMALHHQPARAGAHAQTTAIVHVCDILARGMGYGEPGDGVLPPLDHDAFHGLGLNYHRIDRILVDVEREFAAGAQLFQRPVAP